MLTTQWTTLCIALTQAVLLRHRLPRAFWPCAAFMLGGACMVIVPSVGQSTAGGLHTLRGWMGFLMAIGALSSTVIYYVLLQVSGRAGEWGPHSLLACGRAAAPSAALAAHACPHAAFCPPSPRPSLAGHATLWLHPAAAAAPHEYLLNPALHVPGACWAVATTS